MGQRERVEPPDLVGPRSHDRDRDRRRGERCCRTTDVHYPWDLGGHQSIDDLAPSARSRRIQHSHIGAGPLHRQGPPHRTVRLTTGDRINILVPAIGDGEARPNREAVEADRQRDTAG